MGNRVLKGFKNDYPYIPTIPWGFFHYKYIRKHTWVTWEPPLFPTVLCYNRTRDPSAPEILVVLERVGCACARVYSYSPVPEIRALVLLHRKGFRLV